MPKTTEWPTDSVFSGTHWHGTQSGNAEELIQRDYETAGWAAQAFKELPPVQKETQRTSSKFCQAHKQLLEPRGVIVTRGCRAGLPGLSGAISRNSGGNFCLRASE